MKNEKSLSTLFAITIISASLFSLSACSSGDNVQNDNYGLDQGYNNGLGVSDFGRLNKKTDDTDRGGYSANHSAANYDRPTAQTTTQTTTETIYDSNNSGTNSVYNSTNEANRGLTAQDQGSSDMDIKTTQAIRQQVVAQDEFSSTAKNIKIITINGLVVLKGPVRTMAEKSKIEAIAMNVAGHTKVTNEITVSK